MLAKTGPEYVVIGGKKWAKMNLGATTEAGSWDTCSGDFYQYGSIETIYTAKRTTWPYFDFKSDYYEYYGFHYNSAEYYGTDPILPDENNVVIQKVGGGWRMPTPDDFRALYVACGGVGEYMMPTPGGTSETRSKGIYWCDNFDGVAGLLFCDGTNRVFFPATGVGSDTHLSYYGEYAEYPANSLFNDKFTYAMNFDKNYDMFPNTGADRYRGLPIRPVHD